MQPKQQRSDYVAFAGIPEAPDDAIGGTQAFHLDHPIAITRMIWLVQALRYHTIKAYRGQIPHPALRNFEIASGRRETHSSVIGNFRKELFQLVLALCQR